MATIIPIRGGVDNKGDGGGPENPMLEARVSRPEEKVDRIEGILVRLEPKISEVLQVCAKQADLIRLQTDVAEMKGRLTGIEGRIGTVEGSIAGVEGRFNQVPTIWGMLGLIGTLLIGISGLMFTAGKYFHQ